MKKVWKRQTKSIIMVQSAAQQPFIFKGRVWSTVASKNCSLFWTFLVMQSTEPLLSMLITFSLFFSRCPLLDISHLKKYQEPSAPRLRFLWEWLRAALRLYFTQESTKNWSIWPLPAVKIQKFFWIRVLHPENSRAQKISRYGKLLKNRFFRLGPPRSKKCKKKFCFRFWCQSSSLIVPDNFCNGTRG
jgi:hypothetical protein